MDTFDETLLDDERELIAADGPLRHLAEAGARVRQEAQEVEEIAATLAERGRPRAVVAAGADARLLRAVLEPWCPVPFVAWPGPGLPGWVGPLDIAVVLAPSGGDREASSAVLEAVRRGSLLVLAAPTDSSIAEQGASRDTVLVPSHTGDSLAVAVAVLRVLHALQLGPQVRPEAVAGALDEVSESCGPRLEVGANPGKELALELADAMPLVWGGSVLAARAGRRIAETFRRASGRPALAADAEHLIPVIEGARPRDLFADPFADPSPPSLRPMVIMVDDGAEEPAVREDRGRLRVTAQNHDVRLHTLTWNEGAEVARYAALQSLGTYGAIYLAVGLGHYRS